jgi:hypothetical protein
MDEFINLYREKFGENIEELAETISQYDGNITMIYAIVHDSIEDFIKSKNPYYDFDRCLPYQKNAVRESEAYQAFYIVHGVDYDNLSGYAKGSIISETEINNKRISRVARRKLNNCELLHVPTRDAPNSNNMLR